MSSSVLQMVQTRGWHPTQSTHQSIYWGINKATKMNFRVGKNVNKCQVVARYSAPREWLGERPQHPAKHQQVLDQRTQIISTTSFLLLDVSWMPPKAYPSRRVENFHTTPTSAENTYIFDVKDIVPFAQLNLPWKRSI